MMPDSLVLCYHAVSPRWSAPLSVTPEALERQLTWFVERGWHGSTFREAVLGSPGGRTLVVSFDDAFLSVLELAHPILASLGLVGTVFAPTAFMSSRQCLRWPGIERWLDTPFAPELTGMCWRDLGTLADAGWEIGSHTRSHPTLTRLPAETLREELLGSRIELERHLNRSCSSIAYPYGAVDARVAASAGKAGYAAGAALASRLAHDGPLRWPRVGVYQVDTWPRFRLKASRPIRYARRSRLFGR